MATTSPWPFIHDEREALAADLATLSDEQWATRSLCADWTVRDVLGHMIATAKMTPPAFFTALAGSGFRFNAMNDKTSRGRPHQNPRTGSLSSADISRTPRIPLARWRRCWAKQ